MHAQGSADVYAESGPGPRRALALIAGSTLLSMTVWFSASFVVPQLREAWQLGATGAAWLTVAVQVGFVLGALGLAVSGLVDRVDTRILFSVGSFGAAAANLSLLWCDGLAGAVPARLATGAFLAAVYPPALKRIATWFRRGRGLAMGVMIAALTVGSAVPHLVNAAGGLDWRWVITATSGFALAGGLLILAQHHLGPYPFPRTPFRVSDAAAVLRSRPVMLTNLGYVGHMWELYAMWAYVGAFLLSLSAVTSAVQAAVLAFTAIGVGALGCLAGGVIGDRVGRTQAASLALACSGGACVVLALVGDRTLWLVVPLCLFWGFWVIADSAQFSALATERAGEAYVGTAVSVQLACGYLTTAVSIWLVPYVVDQVSWRAALAVLALGPVVGLAAMQRLQRDDERAATAD